LIQEIWGEQAEVTPGALDVLVNALRSKLDAPFPEKLLHTVRGSGYLLRAEETALAGKAAPAYMRKQIQ
jgi:two-component system copper resistance phosphate regulon response regulator CusR